MEYLTTEEIAAKLRIDVSTVRRMIRAGKIPSVKIGRQYRVTKEALEGFLEAQEVKEHLYTLITNSSLALAR